MCTIVALDRVENGRTILEHLRKVQGQRLLPHGEQITSLVSGENRLLPQVPPEGIEEILLRKCLLLLVRNRPCAQGPVHGAPVAKTADGAFVEVLRLLEQIDEQELPGIAEEPVEGGGRERECFEPLFQVSAQRPVDRRGFGVEQQRGGGSVREGGVFFACRRHLGEEPGRRDRAGFFADRQFARADHQEFALRAGH